MGDECDEYAFETEGLGAAAAEADDAMIIAVDDSDPLPYKERLFVGCGNGLDCFAAGQIIVEGRCDSMRQVFLIDDGPESEPWQ